MPAYLGLLLAELKMALVSAVAAELGLHAPTEIASQVVMRDRLADWAYALAAFCTISEAFALEVRHSSRSEVAEVAESTATGQKGSSSMPHKRNPVQSEKICGLAKVARAAVMPLLEGVALWHERDIGHSSVERISIEDLVTAADHIAHVMLELVTGLGVNSWRMGKNVVTEGSATTLNSLIAAGSTRADAYELARSGHGPARCAAPRVEHVWRALVELSDTPGRAGGFDSGASHVV